MADPITITCPHCETGIRYGYCLCRRCAQLVHIRCAAQCGTQHKNPPDSPSQIQLFEMK